MLEIDIEKRIVNGAWEGYIGRVNRQSIRVFTGKRMSGVELTNFFASGSLDNTKLKVYGPDGPIYLTYESIDISSPGSVAAYSPRVFVEERTLERFIDNFDQYVEGSSGVAKAAAQEALDAKDQLTTDVGQAINELNEVKESNRKRYLDPVATVAERDSAYPTPQNGDSVWVSGEGKMYRYNGTEWKVTNENDPSAIDMVNQQLADKYLLDDIKNMGVSYGEIKMPSDFRSIPFSLNRSHDGRVYHNFDFEQFKTGTKIYVNRDSGNDTSGDGSQGSPYKTLNAALNAASGMPGDKVIICQTYRFDRSETIYNSTNQGITFNGGRVSIIPEDPNEKIIITSGEAGSRALSWTEDSDGVWKATRSLVSNVFDLRKRDFNGVPVPFEYKDTLEGCRETPMSWYSDNASVWVHTKDGVAPDNDNVFVNVYFTCFNFNLLNDATLYIENAEVYGGSLSASNMEVKGAEDGSVGSTFIARNVISVGGPVGKGNPKEALVNNIATINLKNTYLFECKAPYAPRDGFNYHYYKIPAEQRRDCLSVEYDCISYDNGMNDYVNGNNNATTAHEGACALHVNVIGYNTTGPVLHDVHGCYSICIDCSMGKSLSTWLNATANSSYAFQHPTAKAVLINCNAHGENNHLYATAGAKLYVQKLNFSSVLYGAKPVPFLQEIPEG